MKFIRLSGEVGFTRGLTLGKMIKDIVIHNLSFLEQKLAEEGLSLEYGLISGWGFFVFWIGIWISPQPRFIIPIFQNLSVLVPAINFTIPLLHLIISVPFLTVGPWLAINGVKEVTLKVAETHRTEKIVITGVYSIVRHPQHLGALLAHFGISFLLSAWYSLLFTPLMIGLIYLISRKEEEELIREFGKEYQDYKKKVPMLIPKLRSR